LPHTILRNGTYYARLRYPTDLVEAGIAPSHHSKNLRTKDYRLASSVFKALLSPSGRMSRRTFSLCALVQYCVAILPTLKFAHFEKVPLGSVAYNYVLSRLPEGSTYLGNLENHLDYYIAIAAILFAWSFFCIRRKRWHDAGHRGWWILLEIILGPIGLIVAGVTAIIPGQKFVNRYGEPPSFKRDRRRLDKERNRPKTQLIPIPEPLVAENNFTQFSVAPVSLTTSTIPPDQTASILPVPTKEPWELAGEAGEQQFSTDARKAGWIMDKLPQDQASYGQYKDHSEGKHLKRGDFIVRNHRLSSLEVEVKCFTKRGVQDHEYFELEYADWLGHKNMIETVSLDDVIFAIYERDGIHTKANSLRMCSFKYIEKANRAVYDKPSKKMRIPVKHTREGFMILDLFNRDPRY